MKVPTKVREVYQEIEEDLRALKAHSDERLGRFAESHGWFYNSRVKSLESFALKLETGRVTVPREMEDAFGATIVVLNPPQVEHAASLLASDLGLRLDYRRPPDSRRTQKRPSSFQFDDLRLYVRFGQPQGLQPRPYFDRLYEVQIKTLMQHAWGVATHDALYKGPAVSWGRERIGFQTRAILEHVENAITALEQYEGVIAFPAFDEYSHLNNILTILRREWAPDRLPSDLRRLATIIHEMLLALGLSMDQLDAALTSAKARSEGAASLDLSPYQATIVALYDTHEDAFARLTRSKVRLFLSPEVLLVRPELSALPEGVRVLTS